MLHSHGREARAGAASVRCAQPQPAPAVAAPRWGRNGRPCMNWHCVALAAGLLLGGVPRACPDTGCCHVAAHASAAHRYPRPPAMWPLHAAGIPRTWQGPSLLGRRRLSAATCAQAGSVRQGSSPPVRWRAGRRAGATLPEGAAVQGMGEGCREASAPVWRGRCIFKGGGRSGAEEVRGKEREQVRETPRGRGAGDVTCDGVQRVKA